jgi:hypothetical protein
MESTITDWIQAIGVLLGIPVGVWSIISLFRKDKEKEKQLESLSSIATSQNEAVKMLSEQVEQLTIQSNHFQYQGSLMKDANDLTKQQLAMQYDFYVHGKEVEHKKLEWEKNKRIAEIKPYFIFNLSHSSPEMFKLNLENKGGDAKNIRIQNIETKFVWFDPIPKDFSVGKIDVFNISGRPNPENTYFNGNNVTFEINLEFEDIDGNSYYQNIKRLQTGKFIIDDTKMK